MITHALTLLSRAPAFPLLKVWRLRIRQRRTLLHLSDAMLSDIGLSRGDAWREARKHCWEH